VTRDFGIHDPPALMRRASSVYVCFRLSCGHSVDTRLCGDTDAAPKTREHLHERCERKEEGGPISQRRTGPRRLEHRQRSPHRQRPLRPLVSIRQARTASTGRRGRYRRSGRWVALRLYSLQLWRSA